MERPSIIMKIVTFLIVGGLAMAPVIIAVRIPYGKLLRIVQPVPQTAFERILIPQGSTWRFLDDGSDQESAWREIGFLDPYWKSGPAELGYGDGDEVTLVSYGESSDRKYITSFFRHTFTVQRPHAYTELTFRLKCDDGAIVYLNGKEVFRTNLPPGEITYQTQALIPLHTVHEEKIDPSLLVSGINVIAVEVHQVSPDSSDISFDLELSGYQFEPVALSNTGLPSNPQLSD
jgi:hypothetical protein